MPIRLTTKVTSLEARIVPSRSPPNILVATLIPSALAPPAPSTACAATLTLNSSFPPTNSCLPAGGLRLALRQRVAPTLCLGRGRLLRVLLAERLPSTPAADGFPSWFGHFAGITRSDRAFTTGELVWFWIDAVNYRIRGGESRIEQRRREAELAETAVTRSELIVGRRVHPSEDTAVGRERRDKARSRLALRH